MPGDLCSTGMGFAHESNQSFFQLAEERVLQTDLESKSYHNSLAIFGISALVVFKAWALIYSKLSPSILPVHLPWILTFLKGHGNEMFNACQAKCSPKSFLECVWPVIEAIVHI